MINDFEIRFLESAPEKAAVATRILTHLPDWFGIPESTNNYILQSAQSPFFAALCAQEAVGFLALNATAPRTVEIAVMGVLPSFHRQGAGSALFTAARDWARAQGYAFMQVKTVKMGCYDIYDRTNLFYQHMGFEAFECMPTLWDAHNPCQIYVLAL